MSQPTSETHNRNALKRKFSPPTPLVPLKWKKNVNNFQPKIHPFTKNEVIILKIGLSFYIFYVKLIF